MRTNPMMLSPVRAQLDQILWALSKLFGIPPFNVIEKCIWIRNLLEHSKFAHLLRRKRHEAYVAPRLGPGTVRRVFLAAIHHHVGKRFRRGHSLSRTRNWQVSHDQLSIDGNWAGRDNDVRTPKLAGKRLVKPLQCLV